MDEKNPETHIRDTCSAGDKKGTMRNMSCNIGRPVVLSVKVTVCYLTTCCLNGVDNQSTRQKIVQGREENPSDHKKFSLCAMLYISLCHSPMPPQNQK